VADPSKYLLPTERVAISIRRHWAYLVADTLQAIVLLVIGVVLARIVNGVDFIGTVFIWFCVFVVARWIWRLADWFNETLIVTDKRLLLLTGIFYRNVAIMPLVKVTDLTYHRSASGMTFGYGKFVVESAGQDQALSTIDFVPHPDRLYQQISDLLFGGDKGAPGALVTTAQRMAEEENEQLARRRFRRRFTRRRPTDLPNERAGAGPAPSQLDAILADRDTLLADRDDRDWDDRDWDRPSGYRGGPAGPAYPSAHEPPSYDQPPAYDRPPSYGQPPAYGERDWHEEPDRRSSDPSGQLPQIHQPRRGDSSGRNESVRPEAPLPPPRRPGDTPPPGPDPADD
jgi:membrane protein YdbS with pleckstrin-like domain